MEDNNGTRNLQIPYMKIFMCVWYFFFASHLRKYLWKGCLLLYTWYYIFKTKHPKFDCLGLGFHVHALSLSIPCNFKKCSVISMFEITHIFMLFVSNTQYVIVRQGQLHVCKCVVKALCMSCESMLSCFNVKSSSDDVSEIMCEVVLRKFSMLHRH